MMAARPAPPREASKLQMAASSVFPPGFTVSDIIIASRRPSNRPGPAEDDAGHDDDADTAFRDHFLVLMP